MSRQRSAHLTRPLFALAGILGSACSGDRGASASSLELAIVEGEIADASTDGVMKLISLPGTPEQGFCTGTLIAPNLVLTAAHCVSYSTAGKFSCNADGTLETSTSGAGTLRGPVPPGEIEFFVGVEPGQEPDAYGAKVFSTHTTESCRNDFAAVLLDRSLDLSLMAVRLTAPVRKGERMTVIGYGRTEIEGDRQIRRQRANVRVLDVGPNSFEDPVTTATARTFVLAEGGCHGDSGGPAISEETGAITGVYSISRGASCTATGVQNFYSRLSSFKSLIDEAFAEAFAEPILDPLDSEVVEPPPSDEPDDRVTGSGSRSEGCAYAGATGRSPASGWAALGLVALFGVRRIRRA